MRWFRRRTRRAVDHAVIVSYRLSDDEFGTEDERAAVSGLQDRVESLMGLHRVGELDGNEVGGGEALLFCYGPDADRLFAAVEEELRDFPVRPASVTLRYGDAADPQTHERRIEL